MREGLHLEDDSQRAQGRRACLEGCSRSAGSCLAHAITDSLDGVLDVHHVHRPNCPQCPVCSDVLLRVLNAARHLQC